LALSSHGVAMLSIIAVLLSRDKGQRTYRRVREKTSMMLRRLIVLLVERCFVLTLLTASRSRNTNTDDKRMNSSLLHEHPLMMWFPYNPVLSYDYYVSETHTPISNNHNITVRRRVQHIHSRMHAQTCACVTTTALLPYWLAAVGVGVNLFLGENVTSWYCPSYR